MFCTVMIDVDFNVYAGTRRGLDVAAGLHSNYSFSAHEVESLVEQNIFLPISSATPFTTLSKLTVTSVADEENKTPMAMQTPMPSTPISVPV